MMTPARSEFRHAITPPKFERHQIHRGHLVDRIHAEIGKKLIVVIAPPGYGKTSLLSDFISHTDVPVAWAQLSSLDLDPMHFAQLLASSLSRRFRRLRNRIQLSSLGHVPPKALARAILDPIRELLPETFVLALDDAHLVNDSEAALEFLDALLLESPPQLTVLLAARDLPEVSMARLVVDGEMAGLGTEALVFSEAEAEQLAAMSFKEPPEQQDIRELMEQTHGWPAGVVLSLRIAGREAGGVLSGRPMVYEYLGSIAFEGQEPDLREFLLGACVLPVMTAENCNHVLQIQDSGRYLTRLLRRGLFISALDHSPRSYTFHAPFREFLLHTADIENPVHVRARRIRAAEFFEAEGEPETAFQLFLAAKAWPQAASLARRYAYELFITGRSTTLEMWSDALLPSGKAPAILHLLLAASLSDRGQLDAAEKYLALAKAALREQGDDAPRREWVRAGNIEGWLAYRKRDFFQAAKSLEAVESLLDKSIEPKAHSSYLQLKALVSAAQNGDLDRAIGLFQQALDLLQPEEQYPHLRALIQLDILRTLADMGDLKAARDCGESALTLIRELGTPDVLARCSNDLGVIAHLEGHYLDALDFFQQANQSAHQAANPLLEAEIHFSQADLFNDIGLPWQAGELYGEGLTIAASSDDGQLLQYGYLGTCTMHRRWGERDLAREWLERAVNASDTASAAVTIQSAALDIAQSPELAREQLVGLLSIKDDQLPHMQRQLAWYMLGRVEYEMANEKAAAETLERMLNECFLSGSMQPAASEFHADPDFLRFLAKSFPDHSLLSPILQLADAMQTMSQHLRRQATQASKTPSLDLRALGVSMILKNGAHVTGLEPLQRQTLFYLADAGPVPRDVLLEAIWPGVTAGRQLASLYTATHGLRKTLGDDLIQIDGSIYQLNPSLSIAYDVAVFEHAASIAEAALPGDPRRYFALSEAINAYSGPFLPDINTDWTLDRRDELERRLLKLLTAHADEALAQGRTESAVESLRNAVRLAPLRDDLNLRYLQLLGQLGRRDELSAHYRQYTRLLAEELGLDPPAEAQRLYLQFIS
jgi:ATP/maltotriose-dependent transcriptional regulator MalT/DNA-binding SARP family transcriptional activator